MKRNYIFIDEADDHSDTIDAMSLAAWFLAYHKVKPGKFQKRNKGNIEDVEFEMMNDNI